MRDARCILPADDEQQPIERESYGDDDVDDGRKSQKRDIEYARHQGPSEETIIQRRGRFDRQEVAGVDREERRHAEARTYPQQRETFR